jgi:hypothetical protein
MLCNIRGTRCLTKSTKTVLPNLRILQLVFSGGEMKVISDFILSLDLPLLISMCIGAVTAGPIPPLPKSLTERLEYLEFCLPLNGIDAWEAENFRNLRRLRLKWDQLCSASFRSRLPMDQIVELTSTFRFVAIPPQGEVVEQVMDSLLDPSMTPNLRALILVVEEINWYRVEQQKWRYTWHTAYLESLAASFNQRGVDLWFEWRHLRKESVLVRDMICKLKNN